MKWLLMIIVLCATWLTQANELINSSDYGTNYFMPDGRILFEDNVGRTVHITVAPGLLKYQFQDGSYLELLQFQGVAKRYSNLTGILETLPLDGTAASPWQLNTETEDLFNNLNNHTNETFEYTPPVSGGDCNFINGKYLCTPPILDPFSLINPDAYTTTSDSCSYERSRAEKPYLGYTTHGGCTRWTYVSFASSSIAGFALGCFGPQAALGSCAGAFAVYIITAGMANERSNECNLAYTDVMHALQQCESANPPSSGGTGPGGGNGSGEGSSPDFGDYFTITGPGGGGSFCYREFHSESEGTYYIVVPCP